MTAGGADEFAVLAAQVTGAHGVTGNVRLRLVGANAEVAARALQGVKTLRARPEAGAAGRDLTLASLRKQPQPKGAWIAHFKEVPDRNGAEALIGWGLYVPDTGRPPLPPGEYYVDDLLGAEVVTDTGKALGRLTDVLDSPAHDVYETDLGVLIPAVKEYLLDIDVAGRRITVRDVPGLRDEPDARAQP